jgi:hypothetical protein
MRTGRVDVVPVPALVHPEVRIFRRHTRRHLCVRNVGNNNPLHLRVQARRAVDVGGVLVGHVEGTVVVHRGGVDARVGDTLEQPVRPRRRVGDLDFAAHPQ